MPALQPRRSCGTPPSELSAAIAANTQLNGPDCIALSVPLLARFRCCGRGRVIPLCPSTSDVDLFGYGQSVVHFDAEIAYRALDFLVPQQQLYCPQIASTTVDQGRFGPPK